LGFTQGIKDWGQQLGLHELELNADISGVRGLLHDNRVQALDSTWDMFARMPSTRFFASLIRDRHDFHQVALEASRRSRLGLRVFLLAITGSLSQSYLKTRKCPACGAGFDFEHFVSCSFLGVPLVPALTRLGGDKDWKEFVSLILFRFQVFIHLFRQGHCDADESELFEQLCSEKEEE
jgi:hypothetical protein